ncbi:MAG: type II toxin-antitoxin system RelE/ParE family toxin [Betaproteobacteria bacterium]|nr:type II toxin-antitoxin system RelE/ParE family toxin [Betaproteobacteria bacterium]
MHGAASKPLEWTRRAAQAYNATLARVAEDDPLTALLMRERVERALSLIQLQPSIGTPALRRGERRFPVRNTGHVINYRVLRHAIRIVLWYRARQHMRA